MSKDTQEDLAKRLIDEIRNAYTENNIKHIKTLISNITNLDRVIDGDTALTLASEKGLFSVVTFLVEAGASLDVKVKNGDSALIIASKYRYMSKSGQRPTLKQRSPNRRRDRIPRPGKNTRHQWLNNSSPFITEECAKDWGRRNARKCVTRTE